MNGGHMKLWQANFTKQTLPIHCRFHRKTLEAGKTLTYCQSFPLKLSFILAYKEGFTNDYKVPYSRQSRIHK